MKLYVKKYWAWEFLNNLVQEPVASKFTGCVLSYTLGQQSSVAKTSRTRPLRGSFSPLRFPAPQIPWSRHNVKPNVTSNAGLKCQANVLVSHKTRRTMIVLAKFETNLARETTNDARRAARNFWRWLKANNVWNDWPTSQEAIVHSSLKDLLATLVCFHLKPTLLQLSHETTTVTKISSITKPSAHGSLMDGRNGKGLKVTKCPT